MSSPPPTLALGLEYPLGLRGGVSVLVETLLRGLAGRYRLVLVSPDTPEELARHPIAPLLAGHARWDPAAISTAASQALAQRLAELGVQLAHLHIGGVYGWGIRGPGRSPIPFLRRTGIKVCSTVHLTVSLLDGFCGPQKPLWFKLVLLPVAWLGKIAALRHLRTEIAVSHHDARLLRSWYWPYAGRVRQIYHSRLAEEDFRPPEAPRRKVILNVGHLAARKGQHLLLEAFARIAPRHPDWELHLVGPALEENFSQRLRDTAEQSGLGQRLVMPGSVDDALARMSEAAVYVQPSLEEALGLALQEALASGCACIGARTGGIPELITDGDNGLLYPARDVAALAAALERLVADETQRAAFSARGPQSLRERGMTAAQMVERHAALYDEILSAR